MAPPRRPKRPLGASAEAETWSSLSGRYGSRGLRVRPPRPAAPIWRPRGWPG
jgi:hypothetical protein